MKNIILKDIKLMLSDKKALALIILMPIILTTILSFALSGSFQDAGSTWKMKIAVVKQYEAEDDIDEFVKTIKSYSKEFTVKTDMSAITENIGKFNPEKIFLQDFLGNEKLKQIVEYDICNLEEAHKLLENKEINAAIILPKNFVYDSYINMFTPFRNNIEIQVLGHPDMYMSYSYRITQELIKSYNNIISSIVISKNVFMESASKYINLDEVMNGIETVVSGFETNGNDINITSENLKGKNYVSSFAYYTAAMLAMFILYSSGFGGKFLLEEKDNKTYSRILSAGRKKSQILAGKFIMMFVIVIIQSVVMILFSKLLFDINWVSIKLIILTIVLSSLAVASLGMIIAAFTIKTNNYKSADAVSTAVIPLLALFGGSYLPVEQMPKIIGTIGKYTPNGAVLNSYIKIIEGYGISEILPYYMILIVDILVFTVISALVFRGGAKDA